MVLAVVPALGMPRHTDLKDQPEILHKTWSEQSKTVWGRRRELSKESYEILKLFKNNAK